MASYVFDRETGNLIDKAEYYARKFGEVASVTSDLPMPYIRSDIKPYTSPVTGKVIEGRAARREDLARSGCREVDPIEYKPIYRNYEFCQKHRLPYMGDAIPPPMTKDEKAWAKEKRFAMKRAEKEADAVRAKAAESKIDPDLAKFQRGNTKSAPIYKTMDDHPVSMEAAMEKAAKEYEASALLGNAASLGYGTAAGAGVYSMHPAGLLASLPLGALSYFMRQQAKGATANADRSRGAAKMWGETGLPERPLPETPEGDAARQALLDALMRR